MDAGGGAARRTTAAGRARAHPSPRPRGSCGEAPLRERRWVLLATALYRSGRQADALAAIREARERLADELGVEPGAELTELELGILRHDDALDLDETPAVASARLPVSRAAAVRRRGRGRVLRAGCRHRRGARPTRPLAASSPCPARRAAGSRRWCAPGVVPALRRRGDRVVDPLARARSRRPDPRRRLGRGTRRRRGRRPVRGGVPRRRGRRRRRRTGDRGCGGERHDRRPRRALRLPRRVRRASRPRPARRGGRAPRRPDVARRRCARRSSSRRGEPACGSRPASPSSSCGMPRARPARSPTCRTRSSRPGSAARARRSRSPATRHPAASRARSRSRPTASTSRWTPTSGRRAAGSSFD